MDRMMPDLDSRPELFLAAVGHKKRRPWAPLYRRGPLGPSERKSLQPMAACLGLGGPDQLQHIIASPAWDDTPLWRVPAAQAGRLIGGPWAAGANTTCRTCRLGPRSAPWPRPARCAGFASRRISH